MSLMRWISISADGLVAIAALVILIFDLIEIETAAGRAFLLCVSALFAVITLHLLGVIL